MVDTSDATPWTKNEDAYLTEYYGDHSASEIATFLGRTRSAVIGRAHRLKLTNGTRQPSALRKF